MGWVRIDDQYRSNMKALAIGAEGVALDVAGLCFCAANLTDGYIPDNAVATLYPVKNLRRAVEGLVKAGRWHEAHDMSCECRQQGPKAPGPGYWVHDYLEYHPTRIRVFAEREKERAKKREQRRHDDGTYARMSPGDNHRDNPRDTRRESPGESHPSHPIPSPIGISSPYNSRRLSVPIGEMRDLNERQKQLVGRLVDACRGRNRQRVEVEAVEVVRHCSRYVDWALIDEQIGFALDTGAAVMPQAIVPGVVRSAASHGIRMPGYESKAHAS